MDRQKQQKLLEMLRSAKIYDLEFERFNGMPGFFPGQPQYFYILNMRHEDEYDPTLNGLRSGSAGILLMVDHSGTHIDALCHMASDLKLFDGTKITREIQNPEGFTKLGAETIRPILTRGVLLDVASSLNCDTLPEEYLITLDDIAETCKKQGTDIQLGDAVLVRTGYGKYWSDPKKYSKAAGVSFEASMWIAEKKPILVGADNMTWEHPKNRDVKTNTTAPAHWQLIALRGIYIIENLYLEELARDKVYSFLFIALPIKLKGATGSPLRPVAIVI
ncbi:MAG: cyclase family protein [Candidatus Caldarchaeum sp.]